MRTLGGGGGWVLPFAQFGEATIPPFFFFFFWYELFFWTDEMNARRSEVLYISISSSTIIFQFTIYFSFLFFSFLFVFLYR